MNSNFLFFAAILASLITFFVTRRIFIERFRIGPPSLLAGAVAGLVFLALLSYGPILVAVVWALIKWILWALLFLLLICVLILMFIIMVFAGAAGADEGNNSEQFTSLPPSPPAPRHPRRPRFIAVPKTASWRRPPKKATSLRSPLRRATSLRGPL